MTSSVVAVLVGEGDEPHEVEHEHDHVDPAAGAEVVGGGHPPLGEPEPVRGCALDGHVARLLEPEELGEQRAGVGPEAGAVQAAGEILTVDQRER